MIFIMHLLYGKRNAVLYFDIIKNKSSSKSVLSHKSSALYWIRDTESF